MTAAPLPSQTVCPEAEVCEPSPRKTVRVVTGSRLHFGLLAPTPSRSRRFGGVGLMVDSPGADLVISTGHKVAGTNTQGSPISTDGPLAERVADFAARFARSDLAAHATQPLANLRLRVARVAPQHAGLGTGTQLGMAVAAGLACWSGVPSSAITPATLAASVGRGIRSSVGLHGFAAGGLLVDSGKRQPNEIAPVTVRVDFPPDWPIVLVIPNHLRGLSGTAERVAFERLPQASDPSLTGRLCELVLMGLLPCLVQRDSLGFGQALYEMQSLVGEAFAQVQGGVYAHPLIAEVIGQVRQLGIPGVGQSSWGPTVYAVCDHPEQAQWLAAKLARTYPELAQAITITKARNTPAEVLHGVEE